MSTRPFSSRFNIRIIVFSAVVLFLVGYPVAIFVRQALNHGIEDYGAYKKVDLKAMGNFNLDPVTATVSDVPAEYRALDGQKLLLDGQAWDPNDAGPMIRNFELVYSIANCCFGGPPKVQERVFAHVTNPKGLPRPDGNGFVHVTGTLHVTMHRDGGKVVAVYEMDVDHIEPM